MLSRSSDAEIVPPALRTTLAMSVFLFWPNIIGYARVLLAGLACYFMSTEPLLCFLLYGLSCLLDAADGHVARLLDQCSKFGAVLDMVTDRSTTTCLLTYLAMCYPAYALLFQLLISLDLSSHYMHMYSSLVGGATSHKQISKSGNPILRLYYHNRTVLFLVCAGNELFFVLLYLIHHTAPARLPFTYFYALAKPHIRTVHNVCIALVWAVSPVCVLKQAINIVQFINASRSLGKLDTDERNQLHHSSAAVAANSNVVNKVKRQ